MAEERIKSFDQQHNKTNKLIYAPAKTKISLGIHSVWSVFVVHSVGIKGPKVSSCDPVWSES